MYTELRISHEVLAAAAHRSSRLVQGSGWFGVVLGSGANSDLVWGFQVRCLAGLCALKALSEIAQGC